MCWKREAILAIGSCLGVTALCYGLPKLAAFFLKEKKNEDTSEQDASQVEVLCLPPETDDTLSKGRSCVLEDILEVNEDEATSGVFEEDSSMKVSKMDDDKIVDESDVSVNHWEQRMDEVVRMTFIYEDDPEDDYNTFLCHLGMHEDDQTSFSVYENDSEDEDYMYSRHSEQSLNNSAEWTSSAYEDSSDDESDVSVTDEDDKESLSIVIPELKNRYEVYRILGSGGFGVVRLGIDIKTDEPVAIKCVEKMGLIGDLSDVRREIKALKDLSHQHVCRMYKAIETPEEIYMVLELCSKDLFQYIEENQILPENEARRILRQILSALAYIHSQGYAHRDLKSNNIMLDDDKNVKIIDFGLCIKPEGGLGTPLTTFCGTPQFMAPQVLCRKPYLGPAADVWSVGVILYEMLCGEVPFKGDKYGQDISVIVEHILEGYFYVPEHLSPESERLLEDMLQVEEQQRITVKQLLCHPWVTKWYDGPVEWHSTCPTGCST